MDRFYKNWPIIIILVLSLLSHFIFFGKPDETVFDEVHFGKFISGYYTHQYFFDIHPPLAKLLISGAGYLGGFQPGFNFENIGEKFPDKTYIWLRLLPTLAGVFLPLIIFFLILRLGISKIAAFCGGLLIVLENGILVQSRFILLDSFLLLFGFLSLLAYMKYRQENKTQFLFWAGISATLAVLVKLTGLGFIAIIWLAELIKIIKDKGLLNFGYIKKEIVSLVLIPVLIYLGIFAVHFSLLGRSGQGEAFMSQRFQKTLIGNPNQNNVTIEPLGFLGKVTELNVEMYKANSSITTTHPYSSKWYSWPFMIRPIFYWIETGANNLAQAARIYFLGNPIIWWASTIAIVYLAIDLLFTRSSWRSGLIFGAYIINLLPFVFVTRPLFLYHYMTALVIAIISLVYLIDKIPEGFYLDKRVVFTILIILSLASFVFFAPLTYGLPLSPHSYDARLWLNTWQ